MIINLKILISKEMKYFLRKVYKVIKIKISHGCWENLYNKTIMILWVNKNIFWNLMRIIKTIKFWIKPLILIFLMNFRKILTIKFAVGILRQYKNIYISKKYLRYIFLKKDMIIFQIINFYKIHLYLGKKFTIIKW